MTSGSVHCAHSARVPRSSRVVYVRASEEESGRLRAGGDGAPSGECGGPPDGPPGEPGEPHGVRTGEPPPALEASDAEALSSRRRSSSSARSRSRAAFRPASG